MPASAATSALPTACTTDRLTTFLEDDSRRAVLRLARTARADQSAASLDVQLLTCGVPHHLRFEDGRLVGWDLGELPDIRCAIVHRSEDAAARFILGVLTGPDGCDATRIIELRNGTWCEFACPPANLDEIDGTTLRAVPGADLTIRVLLSRTPFGGLDYSLRFEGGRLVQWSWGSCAQPDVVVDLALPRVIDFYEGRTDVVQMIQSDDAPTVHWRDSEWTSLMLAAGLLDSEEFRRMWEQRCAHEGADLVARMGELMSGPGFDPLRAGADVVLARWGVASPQPGGGERG